jgi:hypothetical protein
MQGNIPVKSSAQRARHRALAAVRRHGDAAQEVKRAAQRKRATRRTAGNVQ